MPQLEQPSASASASTTNGPILYTHSIILPQKAANLIPSITPTLHSTLSSLGYEGKFVLTAGFITYDPDLGFTPANTEEIRIHLSDVLEAGEKKIGERLGAVFEGEGEGVRGRLVMYKKGVRWSLRVGEGGGGGMRHRAKWEVEDAEVVGDANIKSGGRREDKGEVGEDCDGSDSSTPSESKGDERRVGTPQDRSIRDLGQKVASMRVVTASTVDFTDPEKDNPRENVQFMVQSDIEYRVGPTDSSYPYGKSDDIKLEEPTFSPWVSLKVLALNGSAAHSDGTPSQWRPEHIVFNPGVTPTGTIILDHHPRRETAAYYTSVPITVINTSEGVQIIVSKKPSETLVGSPSTSITTKIKNFRFSAFLTSNGSEGSQNVAYDFWPVEERSGFDLPKELRPTACFALCMEVEDELPERECSLTMSVLWTDPQRDVFSSGHGDKLQPPGLYHSILQRSTCRFDANRLSDHPDSIDDSGSRRELVVKPRELEVEMERAVMVEVEQNRVGRMRSLGRVLGCVN